MNRVNKIGVIGLGYVGLPLAVELATKYEVIGYDINKTKIQKYLNHIDVTDEVGSERLKKSTIIFTNEPEKMKDCDFFIITVPTPINLDKTPNLKPIISATEIVGKLMKKDSVVVYESTVYPGTTEEICVPILEEISGFNYKSDFKVGYSPERINPGDKKNTLTNIMKIVSGCDEESLEIISEVYGSIITAGLYQADSIKVAEAAKVIENSQRDINIAFMNELSIVFNKMGINTNAVLEAASTKWNFLRFTPGLVGGHCIGVDPYYFIYKAEQLGYHSQIIAAGRKINDEMGKYIAENIIKTLIKSNIMVSNAKIGILGVTFKENCPDVRNSKVIDIIDELKDYGVEIIIYDPFANPEEVKNEYNLFLNSIEDLNQLDCVIVSVAHEEFKKYDIETFNKMLKDNNRVLIDIKSIYKEKLFKDEGYVYWSL